MAAGQMLIALDFHLGPVQEFAVVGDPQPDETQRVLRAIRGGFRPNKVVALKAAMGDTAAMEKAAAAAGRQDRAEAQLTTYICENFTCASPLVGATAVEAALAPPMGQ